MRPLSVLLALSLLSFSLGIQAQEAGQVEKIRLGQHWYGAPVSKKDLLGKIVVLEVWGKN